MTAGPEDNAAAGDGGWLNVIARDWLLILSLSGLTGASLYLGRLPPISGAELQVLFILLILFVTVRTLETGRVFSHLSSRLMGDHRLGAKLVALTFFISLAATNDAALVVMVPLTLALDTGGVDMLVILEALAANAGSALTPFGNPQNLFIYWHYGIAPGKFIVTMAPFSGVFLLLLLLAALPLGARHHRPPPTERVSVSPAAYPGLVLLAVVIMVIVHVLPPTAGLAVIGYAVLFSRSSLRIDYGLLVTFLCFFGIAEDMRLLMPPERAGDEDTFMVSALASQIMSNVPAALVMAKFTTHWKGLLWGTNAGGFGSLIGSLANLIAYRLYLAKATPRAAGMFTAKFLAVNFTALLISIGLYYLIEPG